jgi:WD40 repeat protein
LKQIDPLYLESMLGSIGDIDMFKWLLDEAEVALEAHIDKHGNTLLLKSVLDNKPAIFEHLLAKGANLNAQNDENENCFLLALKSTNKNMYQLIIEALALENPHLQIKETNSGECPLHLAILLYSKSPQIVESLISMDTSRVNEELDVNRRTALFTACQVDSQELVEMLIRKGANVNHLDTKERNCLHMAVALNSSERVMAVLVENFINVDQLDVDNKTPASLSPANRSVCNFLSKKINEMRMQLLNGHRVSHLVNQIQDLTLKSDSLEKENEILRQEIGNLKVTNLMLIKKFETSTLNLRVASGDEDGQIKIWTVNQETWVCRQTLTGHTKAICQLAMLPNGDLASCSADSSIKVWNLAKGVCVKSLTTDKIDQVRVLRVLNVGERLASGTKDGVIKIWNLETCKCVKTSQEHTKAVEDFELTPSGYLISASKDTLIKVWLLDNSNYTLPLKSVLTFTGHRAGVTSVKLKNEKEQLLSAGNDRMIKIWNWQRGSCLQTFDAMPSSSTSSPNLDFSIRSLLIFDHDQVIFSTGCGEIVFYCLKTSSLIKKYTHHASMGVSRIEILPNRKLLSSGRDGSMKIWDLDSELLLKSQQNGLPISCAINISI